MLFFAYWVILSNIGHKWKIWEKDGKVFATHYFTILKVCSNALFNLAVSNSAAGAVCQNGFEICTHPFEDLPTVYKLDSKALAIILL